MSEQHNRDALGRYRQEFFERQNMAPIDDLMHDDYGVPQSGESIRGSDKAWTVYEIYPGIPDLIDYSYRLDGDLAVVEMILDYDEKGYEGGALLSRDSPALLAGSAGLFGHAKPTQSYPLVVVPVLAVVVVVADFGDDRGLSY